MGNKDLVRIGAGRSMAWQVGTDLKGPGNLNDCPFEHIGLWHAFCPGIENKNSGIIDTF